MLYRNGQEEVHIQNITPIAGYHFLYQENKRMITSSIILIVIFLVTISPVIVQIIVYQLNPELPSMEFFRVSFSFGGLRHCLNPYIYMIRSPKFWQSVNNIFPFLRERQRRRVQAETMGSTRETMGSTRETVGSTRETVGCTRETSSIEMVDIEIMSMTEDDSMGEASGTVPVSDVFSIS